MNSGVSAQNFGNDENLRRILAVPTMLGFVGRRKSPDVMQQQTPATPPPPNGTGTVSLSDIDKILLQRCLDGAPRAWQDFVERFLGLVIHVANHTAQSRSITLDETTRDDLVAEVFLTLLASDRAVLRKFRRDSSLATYLTVISRRVIARRLIDQSFQRRLPTSEEPAVEPEDRLADREEVELLMKRLDPQESDVVRMYHLEGKSYQEISELSGIAVNSVGPMLSRARQKMREGA